MRPRETDTVHGVMVSVFGRGVLLLGPSGIGKSACALDLIGRQHKLVADDVVMIRRTGDGLTGYPPATLAGWLHVRGLGICSVADLFGSGALLEEHAIELVVELLPRSDTDERPDALTRFDLCGVRLPVITFIADGSRLASTFVEAAVRYQFAGGMKRTSDFFYEYDTRLQAEGLSLP
jgi:HPr kinase/phosphorylase